MISSNFPAFLAAALLSVACGGPRTDASAPGAAPEVFPTPATAEPPPGAAPGAADPGGGRMAFTRCPDKRPEICTHLYKPVCAEVALSCGASPCSPEKTEKKNYGNSCAACADPKVVGHWPVACDALGGDVASP